ncbi:MAG: hypothetical protein SOS98_00765 [Varibaculum sp.]|nr:hypothetical protein [Varibaculum sp.]
MSMLIGLFVGLGCLVFAAWLRAGSQRSRFWVNGGHWFVDERFALLFLPGLGAMFLGISAGQMMMLFSGSWKYAVSVVCYAVAVAGLVLIVMGMMPTSSTPKWVRPLWLRQLYAATDTKGSATADTKGAAKRGEVEKSRGTANPQKKNRKKRTRW